MRYHYKCKRRILEVQQKAAKVGGLVFFGSLCLEFLFALEIQLVYISQSLIYCHIGKYRYTAKKDFKITSTDV